METDTPLRIIREKHNETISSMARKLKIGSSRYYMIEIGERPATPDLAKKISKLLQVNTENIFLPRSFTVRKTTNDDATGTEG